MGLNTVTTTDGLRAWAKGVYPLEAGVELLLRAFGGRFATEGWPWIEPMDDGFYRVDADVLIEQSRGLSGGERRLLDVVASLIAGDDHKVDLHDVPSGVDRDTLALILAAIAHAGGSHEHSVPVFNADQTGILRFGRPGPLFPWPDSH